jgi:hypothetical protein
MVTRVEFKKLVKDFAKLEGEAVISIGTTGFAGDGDRLFLNSMTWGSCFPTTMRVHFCLRPHALLKR